MVVPGPDVLQGGHRQLPQPLGLGTGDQGAAVHRHLDGPEGGSALEVLERFARQAPGHQGVEGGPLRTGSARPLATARPATAAARREASWAGSSTTSIKAERDAYPPCSRLRGSPPGGRQAHYRRR